MDNTAVQAIGQLAVDAQKANRLGTFTPALILRAQDGCQKIKSIEHLQESRTRFRGTFTTASMQDFMLYVVKNRGGHGFIDIDRMAATVLFNLLYSAPTGTHETLPGHADHIAVLRLKRAPAFDALCTASVSSGPFSQKGIVEWLEDWSDNLAADYPEATDPTVADPQRIKQAITALRKVKIKATGEATHTEKNFGASKSALEDIEASSDVGLPRGFRFTCEPYDGFDTSTFYIRLGVNADPEKPTFKLRWPHYNRDMEALGQQFKAKLSDGVGDNATLLLGNFDPGE
jgi:uncharacterized protein YfdQ (DUF2303 family)